jgi:hypothetical protein
LLAVNGSAFQTLFFQALEQLNFLFFRLITGGPGF